MSAQSDIDHPLCEECTDTLLDQLDHQLKVTTDELNDYSKEFVDKIDGSKEEDTELLAKELEDLKLEESQLMQVLIVWNFGMTIYPYSSLCLKSTPGPPHLPLALTPSHLALTPSHLAHTPPCHTLSYTPHTPSCTPYSASSFLIFPIYSPLPCPPSPLIPLTVIPHTPTLKHTVRHCVHGCTSHPHLPISLPPLSLILCLRPHPYSIIFPGIGKG